MTIVREIADATQMLAEVVRNTRELAETVNDGRKFLASQHPEAKADLTEMLEQMQTTIEGLARATSVVTGFKFTITGTDVDREPARFNAYIIEQKEEVAKLRGDITKLKGSCEKIREAHDRLNELAGDKNDWAAMFRLFGKERREMNNRLAVTLYEFYGADQNMIEHIERILKLSRAALNDADKALGPAGMASPDQVSTAAAVLNFYAAAFKTSEAELDTLVETLEKSAKALR